MFYRLAADGILILHACVILFIIAGLALILVGAARQWRWVTNVPFRMIHLLAIAYVAGQAIVGVACPLTVWENKLRELGGEDPYGEVGFIAYWLHRAIFFRAEAWVFTIAYVSFALLVAGTMWFAPPRRRRRRTVEEASIANMPSSETSSQQ